VWGAKDCIVMVYCHGQYMTIKSMNFDMTIQSMNILHVKGIGYDGRGVFRARVSAMHLQITKYPHSKALAHVDSI
jgi:hypothetical protein